MTEHESPNNESPKNNNLDKDLESEESEEDPYYEAPGSLKKSVPAAIGSICWLNMIPNEEDQKKIGKLVPENPNNGIPRHSVSADKDNRRFSESDPESNSEKMGCCFRILDKILQFFEWILHDFSLKHLIWIKLIFLFQSASMTVLYPYLNLHMKSLGISVQETAVINAVIPILFIFTPPLAGFLADKLGNFRILLAILTALGGLVALLLLIVPQGRDVTPYPDTLDWGVSCGKAENRARFQKMMLHGFRRDQCQIQSSGYLNVTFTPGTCGYLCPTRNPVDVKPNFFEYKVIWPNRGGGFGISEIVDVVTLDSPEARLYHEPNVIDDNIFFPMNWTFHLSCDRIRPNDCIFNPIRRAPTRMVYNIQALSTSTNLEKLSREGPEFEIESIIPPETGRPVSVPVNCGAKEIIAQVVSTVETSSLPSSASAQVPEETVDTRFSGCTLHCMVSVPRHEVCNNTNVGVVYDPAITFWSYLMVRTALGVLTAASLMMFEGAVMATIQEMGGDYGIQRFVGNFGAIIFAPLGGYIIDIYSKVDKVNFSVAIYIYLGLKLGAAFMILFIELDFRPPGERILKNIGQVLRNFEVVMFLIQMMFAGTFWGFIEGFLFWFLDDLGASKLLMGWTVAVGMMTSLPFLIFSGPITELLGHINVIVIGMLAYCIRLLGYSFLQDPVYVYPYEALEGFTMALMMTSAVTYVAKISSPSTIASVMGIMGALFFGIGKGSGSLFGGLLMGYIGARSAFRVFAGLALLSACVYILFQLCYGSKQKKKRVKIRDLENANNGLSNGHRIDREKMNSNGLVLTPNGSPNGVKNGGFDSSNDGRDSKTPNSEEDQGSTSAIYENAKERALNDSQSLRGSGPRSLTGGTTV
ncbi:uncharacterized protein LOC131888779 [Tigriopus californicus]|uniref:uncharacterized protein LOC131888779 n=1 Tax=Tigriopus californicus TaxID=6832 RepID=UPI0027D9E616|nr:uncharacterized protein LOC131888779 [Tigriopus californicus]